MKLISVEDMRKLEVVNAPTDDLISLYNTCLQMQHVCQVESGVGLSAVQVGIPWKLFIIKGPDGYEYMINCEYEPLDDKKSTILEGCLSLVNSKGNLRRFNVARYDNIVVRGKLLFDKGSELSLVDIEKSYFNNFFGIVAQHEIDHHRGILISDIGEEVHVYKM